jgi:hypothetical protein
MAPYHCDHETEWVGGPYHLQTRFDCTFGDTNASEGKYSHDYSTAHLEGLLKRAIYDKVIMYLGLTL